MDETAPPLAAESPADAAALASGHGNGTTAPYVSRIPPPPAALPEPVFGDYGMQVRLADGRLWWMPPPLLAEVFGPLGDLMMKLIGMGVKLKDDPTPQDFLLLLLGGAEGMVYDLAFMVFRRNYPTILQREDMAALIDTWSALGIVRAILDPLREQFALLGLGSLVQGKSAGTPIH